MNRPLVKQILSVVLINILLQAGHPAMAAEPDETTTIILDQPVHFLGTDGSDVVADPGDYSVEAAQEWLRLIPGTERRDALLVEAQPGTHEVKVEIPIVISTPGTEPDDADVHVVQYLNPDGTSLVATGTYSGIQLRGLLDRARQAAALAQQAAEAARQAAATQAQQAAAAARNAALRAKQAAEKIAARVPQIPQSLIARLKEATLEESGRVPPTKFLVGSDNSFSDASGWRRQVCQWVEGHLFSLNDWGCQSHIDLATGRILVKADRYGAGIRMNIHAEAWVEMYKDFTVPPQSGSGQNQTKIATFNVPIEYHGKAISTFPTWAASYKIFLKLTEISVDAGPVYPSMQLEERELENKTVRAFIKVIKGIPIPIPGVDLTTQKNPVYFSAPVIPGRIYRLTLRVEVGAGGNPVQGTIIGWGDGSAVNLMDKAMIISEAQRVDGYIKWGPIKLKINP